jgi:hypothetical protein
MVLRKIGVKTCRVRQYDKKETEHQVNECAERERKIYAYATVDVTSMTERYCAGTRSKMGLRFDGRMKPGVPSTWGYRL